MASWSNLAPIKKGKVCFTAILPSFLFISTARHGKATENSFPQPCEHGHHCLCRRVRTILLAINVWRQSWTLNLNLQDDNQLNAETSCNCFYSWSVLLPIKYRKNASRQGSVWKTFLQTHRSPCLVQVQLLITDFFDTGIDDGYDNSDSWQPR